MIVIADTGPVHYLILCGDIGLLHELYGGVVIPAAVKSELSHPGAPDKVRTWIADPPSWASFKAPGSGTGFDRLGPGEREALRLGMELQADFVLIDETLGRRLATESALAVKGTLGVLEEASKKLNHDLKAAVERLRQTGIYLDEDLIAAALERDRARRELSQVEDPARNLDRGLEP